MQRVMWWQQGDTQMKTFVMLTVLTAFASIQTAVAADYLCKVTSNKEFVPQAVEKIRKPSRRSHQEPGWRQTPRRDIHRERNPGDSFETMLVDDSTENNLDPSAIPRSSFVTAPRNRCSISTTTWSSTPFTAGGRRTCSGFSSLDRDERRLREAVRPGCDGFGLALNRLI